MQNFSLYSTPPVLHYYKSTIYLYMNKLDPNTLFSIFSQDDQEVYREHNVQELLNNPYVLIGMVVNGVENFYIIDKMYLLKYGERYQNVREGIKHKYFNKLYSYIQRIDNTGLNDIYTIGDSYDLSKSINSLLELQLYFETFEEYEKCKDIKYYCDLLVEKQLEKLI